MPEDQLQPQIQAQPVSLPSREVNASVATEEPGGVPSIEATHQIPEGIPGVLEPVPQPSLDAVLEAEPQAQVHPVRIANVTGEKVVVTPPDGVTDENAEGLLTRKPDDGRRWGALLYLRQKIRGQAA